MKTHTGKFNNPKKSFIKLPFEFIKLPFEFIKLPFEINYFLNFFKSKRKIYNNKDNDMDNNMNTEVNYNNYSHGDNYDVIDNNIDENNNNIDENMLNTCKINNVDIDTFINVMDDCYFLIFYLDKIQDEYNKILSMQSKYFYNNVNNYKKFITLLITSLEIISTYSNINDCKKEIIKFLKYNYKYYEILYKSIINDIVIISEYNNKIVNFNYNVFSININKLIKYYSSCKYTDNSSYAIYTKDKYLFS
jgi:hypothetical protein